MNPVTMYDFFEYVNYAPQCYEVWNVKIPVRISDLPEWNGHIIEWSTFTRCQKLIVLKFIGTKEEREPFKDMYAKKPKDVSWRQLIEACFDKDLRRPILERLAYRNRLEPKGDDHV